jgi:hypothetical protein
MLKLYAKTTQLSFIKVSQSMITKTQRAQMITKFTQRLNQNDTIPNQTI